MDKNLSGEKRPVDRLVMPLTEEALGEAITKIADVFDTDLYEKDESDLEEYWHFKWNSSQSLEWNTYQFYDLLKLYGSICRQWEEKHNGHCCVVERVRDKYLWPKIKDFVSKFTTALGSTA